jgi:hypothetical protein
MKSRLIILVMLIACLSCGTNNKPVSDAQKEKMKGEVKEVVNTFIKGCEEANADKVMEFFLNSPDFIDITNGMTFSYKEMMDMKPNFNAVLNQKCTIINEKYTFLEKATVLYTARTKWSTNYKDGHSSITDPQAFLIIFKKIDNRWRVIYLVDSNVEKNVPNESSKVLNQVELMKKFTGNWKGEIGKDTTIIGTNTSFGNGMECNSQIVTKGKILNSLKQLFGYDEKNDKFIMEELSKSPSATEICAFWFTSKNTGRMVLFQDISNPENANLKWEIEFTSPDKIIQTALQNNKVIKTVTITRVGK